MGLEFARQLGLRGYDLLLVSNRAEELAAAASELQGSLPDSQAGGAVAIRTHWSDLALANAADNLFSWCMEEKIVPDVLVNDAGMFFFKELGVADLDKVQAMIHLHVTPVPGLCLLFGEEMKKRGSGYILNVSSMAARLPVPGITVYSATKAYLKSFGKSLSYEFQPYGVGVTCHHQGMQNIWDLFGRISTGLPVLAGVLLPHIVQCPVGLGQSLSGRKLL